MQSPSANDVRKLFEFLFRMIDDKIVIKSLDVDVPIIMKNLSYPFQINKSYLLSSASLQAKGHIFGMLDWLVDAITVS